MKDLDPVLLIIIVLAGIGAGFTVFSKKKDNEDIKKKPDVTIWPGTGISKPNNSSFNFTPDSIEAKPVIEEPTRIIKVPKTEIVFGGVLTTMPVGGSVGFQLPPPPTANGKPVSYAPITGRILNRTDPYRPQTLGVQSALAGILNKA